MRKNENRQTVGNLDLTVDENLLDDTRPIILHNYRLCTVITSCLLVGLFTFGVGYLTRDQYSTECECVCDGSV
jgi:hypothetical protein